MCVGVSVCLCVCVGLCVSVCARARSRGRIFHILMLEPLLISTLSVSFCQITDKNFISMYVMCVILCLFSVWSSRVGTLQISIIIILRVNYQCRLFHSVRTAPPPPPRLPLPGTTTCITVRTLKIPNTGRLLLIGHSNRIFCTYW